MLLVRRMPTSGMQEAAAQWQRALHLFASVSPAGLQADATRLLGFRVFGFRALGFWVLRFAQLQNAGLPFLGGSGFA